MTDDDLELIFKNWARWVRDRSFRKKHCYSIEGRYRSPQHWHPPEPRPPEVDWQEALKIEKIVVRLPKKYTALLVGHYVKLSNPMSICRKIAIRFNDYEATLQMARIMVRNNLHDQTRKDRVRAA